MEILRVKKFEECWGWIVFIISHLSCSKNLTRPWDLSRWGIDCWREHFFPFWEFVPKYLFWARLLWFSFSSFLFFSFTASQLCLIYPPLSIFFFSNLQDFIFLSTCLKVHAFLHQLLCRNSLRNWGTFFLVAISKTQSFSKQSLYFYFKCCSWLFCT